LERIKSAGIFHSITGKGKTVALHFPWDGSNKSDIKKLKSALKNAGVAPGSVNSNLFGMRKSGALGESLRFGSFTNPDKIVRDASVKHNIECLEFARILGSDMLVIWLPDGTNSPGQMSLYDQADRVEESLKKIYKALIKGEKILIEYKLFEPGFYSTAIQDYARSFSLCEMLGKSANALVDLGHHAHGVNVEQIIAHLMRVGRLGGFHFNDSYYADDDLASGSLHPHQLFRIFANLIEGEFRGYEKVHDLALMIDQSHNIKNPIEELIESVENIEIAYAKALLIDFDKLKKTQDSCDISLADHMLANAFNADVRPILHEARKSQGLPENPLLAFREL
ncbi:MAG: TIM barrel protein, partial [bacterium]